MLIEIVSDVVCPWCFVGKRQIEAALADHARANPDGEAPRISWKPFELNPTLPDDGMSRHEYVTAKFGAARSKDVYARVTAVGIQHGIPFQFDRIQRQPNTLAAHSLIALADNEDSTAGLQDRVVEALFHAYFVEGIDLTRDENLATIAVDAGLDRARVDACLADPAARRAVREEEDRFREMGVEGVPFFIFDRRIAVSGAQGSAALREVIRQLETAPA
jgi:predicted DsbA family dithiol-disulfide isomerase